MISKSFKHSDIDFKEGENLFLLKMINEILTNFLESYENLNSELEDMKN